MKIRSGKAVVSVLGLGRVGLPLAIVLARSGLRVIGVDVDAQVVNMVSKGEMPFYHPEVQTWLKEVLGTGAFTASTESKKSIEASDVIIVAVGTPTGVQHQLEYSQFHSAIGEVRKASLRNKAVIMRLTSFPGTLTHVVLPALTEGTGLEPGVDFAIAVCPERVLEGQSHRELYELPELVGGADSLSVAIASEIFRKINPEKKILATTSTAAELAKLFTNIHRYVNFALANEFAMWAERYGEDAHEIIRIANEGYPRSNIPRPGFTGGPCLSKDIWLLDNSTAFSGIASVSWKLNEAVPQHAVDSLMDELGSLYGRRIAVLGLAFKAGSDDMRLSPSVKLVELLRAYGAEVLAHDPFIKTTLPLEAVLQGAEVVVLATNHPTFRELALAIDASGCKIVYDVWGMFGPNEFVKAKYRRFGRAK